MSETTSSLGEPPEPLGEPPEPLGEPPEPLGESPDPIESDDLVVLRTAILRLREQELGAQGRAEVLGDRVEELEASEAALAHDVASLRAELDRSPIARIARAVSRRLKARR